MLAAMSRKSLPAVAGPAPDANDLARSPGWSRAIRVADGGHVSVLLSQSVEGLLPRSGAHYVDGTFGGGGHTRALLAASAPDGHVIAIDADPGAIARGAAVRAELETVKPGSGDRLTMVHGNFREMDRLLAGHGIDAVDGVLLDLGLSSFQLDGAERGFAFRLDGPLDMRFDPTQALSAADLVNTLDEAGLADVIYRYGEEHRSRRIAGAIVARRATTPFASTADLAAVVQRAAGGRRGETHPATKTFQALRIVVNGELDALTDGLAASGRLLRPGGRLAVISFHSLEDRIVKRFIADAAATCVCPPRQPVCTCGTVPSLRKVGGAIKAPADEVAANPRSRSAILRIAERLDEEGRPVDARMTNEATNDMTAGDTR